MGCRRDYWDDDDWWDHDDLDDDDCMTYGGLVIFMILGIGGLIMVSCILCCSYCNINKRWAALKDCCPCGNIHHPAPPPAQSDDVIPTTWETYQMTPLQTSCPSAAYPDRTRAAVPSRATDGYQLEPKAGPPPDVGGNSNDEPPSYANLFPEN